MELRYLTHLLEAAAIDPVRPGLTVYPAGDTTNGVKLSYGELYSLAKSNSTLLRQLDSFYTGAIILLHFDNHLSNLVWFWSVLYAGGIPAMSTPFTNIPAQRAAHIAHLKNVLQNPMVLTSLNLLDQFDGNETLDIRTIEGLNAEKSSKSGIEPTEITPEPTQKTPRDTALLMLTSGSTGNAKVVCLRHGQLIASVAGKASCSPMLEGCSFLNWIGLDHVAGIVEIHLQALYVHADQVHVQAADIIPNPLVFLNLISRHRVSKTFGPNFFLKKLQEALDLDRSSLDENLDLGCLRSIASGGEANVVATCKTVAGQLAAYGAPENVIMTGFGMTETCAGSIFNVNCPDYDLERGYEFACLGPCMPGINMRVTIPGDDNTLASLGETGNLEVSGAVVFNEYLNNETATKESFTSDGWFKTGDQAIIDDHGYLRIVGRTKETMTVNGVKYLPHEIEESIREAQIPGVESGFEACFEYRSSGMSTEGICVVYLPTYSPEDVAARVQANDGIVKVTMLRTGAKPHVLPLPNHLLEKTTLGKLSRTKIKTAFQKGEYESYDEANRQAIEQHRMSFSTAEAANDTEATLLKVCSETFQFEDLGVDTPFFEMGVTSIDLIRLKKNIELAFSLQGIPVTTMMLNPTVRSLAKALQALAPEQYDPVVTLQQKGDKTPLWLVHPGVGEVLVFLNLAKYFTDRPIYALRARGFDGEPFFEDIKEIVTTYHAAIKAKQPNGPYAIAGYSYGSMLAVETTKILESNGDEVRFLGAFNLPPHIKFRMQQLDWTYVLLHLAYFLGLVTEDFAHAVAADLRDKPREKALDFIISAADPARVAELSMTQTTLCNWANLSHQMQEMGKDYDPSGSVPRIDVFYATPLKAVAETRQEWLDQYLVHWKDFCSSPPRYHEVDGSHYTMIDANHVYGFQKTLKRAIRARGL